MDNKHWTVVQVPAQAERLHALRNLVREQATANGFTPACVDDLVLAVNEAFTSTWRRGVDEPCDGLDLGKKCGDVFLASRVHWCKGLQRSRFGNLGTHGRHERFVNGPPSLRTGLAVYLHV